MDASKAKIIREMVRDALKADSADQLDPFFCQLLLFDCDQVTVLSLSLDERGEYLDSNHLNALRAAYAMMQAEIIRLETIELQGTELLQ